MKKLQVPSQHLAKVAKDKEEPKALDFLSAESTVGGGIAGGYQGMKLGGKLGEKIGEKTGVGMYVARPKTSVRTKAPSWGGGYLYRFSGSSPFSHKLYEKRISGPLERLREAKRASDVATQRVLDLQDRRDKVEELLSKYKADAYFEGRLQSIKKEKQATVLYEKLKQRYNAAQEAEKAAKVTYDRISYNNNHNWRDDISDQIRREIKNRADRIYGKRIGRKVGQGVLGTTGAVLGAATLYSLTNPKARAKIAEKIG